MKCKNTKSFNMNKTFDALKLPVALITINQKEINPKLSSNY